eukprot:TRINITY_DN1555_c0_g1_i1.p1 TRINITY_DN1555_c0_g1~~TRINITY_DN1555_c0_g1_i1.p1  ORF type:complete len:558 (-),score=65.93 TRINITY_DN1555_c0_g1_i1:394-2067(-)
MWRPCFAVLCSILPCFHDGYRNNLDEVGCRIRNRTDDAVIHLGDMEWNLRDPLMSSEHLQGLNQFLTIYLAWKRRTRVDFLRRIEVFDDEDVVIGSDLHGRYGSLHAILSRFGAHLVLEKEYQFASVHLDPQEANTSMSDNDDAQSAKTDAKTDDVGNGGDRLDAAATSRAVEPHLESKGTSASEDHDGEDKDLENDDSIIKDKVSENSDASGDSSDEQSDEVASFNASFQSESPSNRSGGSRFVFLGDYVDRGKHSLEVLVLLLYLEMENAHDNPSYDKVVLLRGNHETEAMNKRYGFQKHFNDTFGPINESLAEEVWSLMLDVFEYLPPIAQISNKEGEHQAVLMHGSLGLTARNAFLSKNHTMNLHNFALPAWTAPEKQILWETMWSDPMASEEFREPQEGDALFLKEDGQYIVSTLSKRMLEMTRSVGLPLTWDPEGKELYARASYRGNLKELGGKSPFSVSKSGMREALKAIRTSWCISGHRHKNTDLWQDEESGTGHFLVLSANHYHGEAGHPDDSSNVVVLKKDGPTREIVHVPDTPVFNEADSLLPKFR